jgi:hypothetical protein
VKRSAVACPFQAKATDSIERRSGRTGQGRESLCSACGFMEP